MNNAFYHLSETLLDTITEDFNDIFKNINGNPSVLIPSAGDGVIADHLKQKAKTSYRKAEIDCIEEDPCLAKALETKGYPVVHNDFLFFRTYKRYDIIFLNPPESYFGHRRQHRKAEILFHYKGVGYLLLPPPFAKIFFGSMRYVFAPCSNAYPSPWISVCLCTLS